MKSHDLRCMCRRRPILAKYGRDSKGRPFVHVKIHKQRQVYGEMVFTEGVCRIRCRECLRWYTVKIRMTKEGVQVQEEPLPMEISAEVLASSTQG